MGASVGTSSEGSVDVELNVVPFIDLMSCLTAFLLVTAVWSQFKQISIKPKGLSRNIEKETDPKEEVFASVLLTPNEIWVGLTLGDRVHIANSDGKYDLEAYAGELARNSKRCQR